jgi:ureidoacrylate peracid hydrolase
MVPHSDRRLEQVLLQGALGLIVIDFQNDYCHPQGALGRAGWDLQYVDPAVRRTAAFLDEARRAGIPVVFVRTEHGPWTDSDSWRRRYKDFDIRRDPVCLEGSWGAEFYGVSPHPKDRVVVKHRYNAFAFSELELVLKSREVRTLLLSGVATNVCVETTARDGFVRDYDVVLLEDCCASYTLAEHQAALHNIDAYFGTVATSADVTGLIRAWPGSSGQPAAGPAGRVVAERGVGPGN